MAYKCICKAKHRSKFALHMHQVKCAVYAAWRKARYGAAAARWY